MLMSKPNYVVLFCNKDNEIELVVSGSDNVENLVNTLLFNKVRKITIDYQESVNSPHRTYEIKVSKIED